MAAERANFLARLLPRFRRTIRPVEAHPPWLSLLEYAREPEAADWLRASMTTFAESVASILPGHFDAYARIYHPFGDAIVGAPESSWRELSAAAGVDLRDPAAAVALAYHDAERVGRRGSGACRES